MRSRTVRSLSTFVGGMAALGASLVTGLVTTPLLLKWLGDDRLGAYRAAFDWMNSVSLLELGLGTALGALLANALGRDDPDGLFGLMAAGRRAYRAVAVAMAVTTLALSAAMPALVGVRPEYVGELRAGCLLMLVTAVWMPFVPIRLLAEADQRGGLINALILMQNLVIAAVALLLAWVGWGITGQFAALVIGGAVVPVALLADSRRRYPDLWHGRHALPPLTRATSLWRLNWPNFLHSVYGRVSQSSDVMLLSLILGSGRVVPYVVTTRLLALAAVPITIIGSATWAGLAELLARGEHELFRDRLYQLTFLTSLAGSLLILPAAVCNSAFVGLWVGAERYAGHGLTALIALSVWCQGLVLLWGWVFTASGRVHRLIPCLLVAVATSLLCGSFATWFIGLPGPLLGTLASYLLVQSWWTPRLLRQHFGLEPRRLARAVLRPWLAAVPCGGVLYLVVGRWPPTDWPSLAVTFGAAVLGMALASWAFVLTPDERQDWRWRLTMFRRWVAA